jgi:hypothetical protein
VRICISTNSRKAAPCGVLLSVKTNRFFPLAVFQAARSESIGRASQTYGMRRFYYRLNSNGMKEKEGRKIFRPYIAGWLTLLPSCSKNSYNLNYRRWNGDNDYFCKIFL